MSKTDSVRILGLDSGLANIGLAVLQFSTSELPRVLGVRLVTTERQAKSTKRKKTTKKKRKVRKARSNIKIIDDDHRRFELVYRGVEAFVNEWGIQAIGIESYAPNPLQRGMSNSAWKTATSYGVGLAVGFAHRLPIFPFWPQDLRRTLLGRQGATKDEIAQEVLRRLAHQPELADLIAEEAAASYREHLFDGIGHGILAALKMNEYRKLGLTGLPYRMG